MTLDEIRKICLAQQITMAELISTLDDARKDATVFNKRGDEIPDHGTRIKATTTLLQLLQLPLLGKAAALKELTGESPASLQELVSRRLALQAVPEASGGSSTRRDDLPRPEVPAI